MSPQQRAELFHQLATLLNSGLSMLRSLDVLLKQPRPQPVRAWIEGLEVGLRRGLPIREALANTTGAIPLEIQVLAAADRAGVVSRACARLSQYFETVHLARRKALSGLVYPMFLIHLGVILEPLPRWFAVGFEVSSLASPLISLASVWVGVALLWKGLSGLIRRAESSPALDALLNRIPLWGRARRHWALSRWGFVAESGIQAGVGIQEVLRLAGTASGSARLSAASMQAGTRIALGEGLANALQATGEFPRECVDAIRIGEQSGLMAEEFERFSRLESEAAVSALEGAAAMLPKAVYVGASLWIVRMILVKELGRYQVLQELLNGQ